MARRGRRPEPWFREQTGTWYVTLGGRQVPLGRDEAAAYDEFYRLMAARGEGTAAGGNVSVRHLKEMWLQSRGRDCSGHTMENYRLYGESFAEMFGGLKARDLRPFHADQWATELEGRWKEETGRPWAQSTRAIALTCVKAMTSWGDEMGYLDDDPLRKLKAPAIERRDPITLEEAMGVIERVRPEIQDALRVLLTTGVRPGELCSMTAEKTDLAARKAVVKGKSGVRTVYLSPPAIAVLEGMKARHPKGPLLIDTLGEPLTTNALQQCIKLARRRWSRERFDGDEMRLEHVVPHCFRGLFSTEALRAGVPMFEVSKLLGHKDPTMLAKHYAAADDEMMRAAADRATRRYDNSSDTPPGHPG